MSLLRDDAGQAAQLTFPFDLADDDPIPAFGRDVEQFGRLAHLYCRSVHCRTETSDEPIVSYMSIANLPLVRVRVRAAWVNETSACMVASLAVSGLPVCEFLNRRRSIK